MNKLKEENHEVDLCVVGGGMSGICAALSAARHGAKVILMHDRPVWGGNASSECRVHICGADRHNILKDLRETGTLEEIRLDNLYRNPNRNFSVWDTLLYEKILSEKNIIPLLNCSCLDAKMNGNVIDSVKGWQLTTQIFHTVHADIFADCSGDGILAPLTGAECRIGREARDEYGESIAPEKADKKTMGMTCLFQSREYDSPQIFEPPYWALTYESCDELPQGAQGHKWWKMGYWWVELGGEHDSIHDTELMRDELLKIVHGLWDHIKNRCPLCSKKARNWAIEWIQFLPAKRESRRFMGAHVLTQNDIESEGKFEDIVAYGGWTMDDHHPAGFNAVKLNAPPTIFHKSPSPYGIPYGCLYSRNIENLMFAGRNASCTHAAMSSTRVMGTCSVMGQALGTAAALAIKKNINPPQVASHIDLLQQTLLKDDAYLPWVPQSFSPLTVNAQLRASVNDPEPVRDGTNRPVEEDTHRWPCGSGDWIEYDFDQPTMIRELSLIMDSGLDKDVALSRLYEGEQLTAPPEVIPKGFHIDGLISGEWHRLKKVENNCQRLYRARVQKKLTKIRFTLDSTWGADRSCLYAFYVE